VTVEFNAKVSSTTATRSRAFEKLRGRAEDISEEYISDTWKTQVSLKSAFSSQRQTGTSRDQRQFSLQIKVVAEQDDTPVGMSRILGVLEESISTNAKSLA
jgi:c-di-GMP-binding flagellar brake protein YcgR